MTTEQPSLSESDVSTSGSASAANGPSTSSDAPEATPAHDQRADDGTAQAPSSNDPPAEAESTAAATTGDRSGTQAEKSRRRVQLRPTYSPELVKPVPTIAPAAAAPADPTVATPEAADAPPQPSEPAPESEPTPMPQIAAESSDDDAASTASADQGDRPQSRHQPVELPPRNEQLDEDIEAQLNAALASEDALGTSSVPEGDLEAEPGPIALPRDDQIKKGARLVGTVQSIHGDDMFIDLGVRMAGVLSRRQFGLRKQPMQGESITVVVNRIDENEGLIHVNLPSGASRVRGNWEELSVDQTVECQVNATNKGGLEVTVGSLRGFMPASQVELGYVADLSSYVGQKLRAQITEVNPKRRKLVLSRRKLLEVERTQTEQEVFGKIAPGQTYEGRVKTIKDYGAFVDIGGVDGLLHVGQISWSRINHPSDVLSEGQLIEVKVLSVDPDKKKISLGMRQMSQNPWKAAADKYTAGTVARGKVTRIENFGAFIELEPGIEGLVHISELDHQRIRTVHEVLRVGQEIDVQVLEVDPSRKRIGLSVKALKEKPEEAAPPEDTSPPVRRPSPETLKGGIGEPTGGQLFGDPSRFGR